MTRDLMDRQILVGKTREQIRDLLGDPDRTDAESYGYTVITIARCHFWNCEMTVNFDKTSKLAAHVAVED